MLEGRRSRTCCCRLSGCLGFSLPRDVEAPQRAQPLLEKQLTLVADQFSRRSVGSMDFVPSCTPAREGLRTQSVIFKAALRVACRTRDTRRIIARNLAAVFVPKSRASQTSRPTRLVRPVLWLSVSGPHESRAPAVGSTHFEAKTEQTSAAQGASSHVRCKSLQARRKGTGACMLHPDPGQASWQRNPSPVRPKGCREHAVGIVAFDQRAPSRFYNAHIGHALARAVVLPTGLLCLAAPQIQGQKKHHTHHEQE